MNIVFYDGRCGLCDHTVQLMLRIDKKGIFKYAPLQGETAVRLLKGRLKELLEEDTLILMEGAETLNPSITIRGKAVLRIFWLLGGGWKLIGWLSFLPSYLFDALYKIVARNRHRFFKQEACVIPSKETQKRFLP